MVIIPRLFSDSSEDLLLSVVDSLLGALVGEVSLDITIDRVCFDAPQPI
jgi:hypothetical protein